MKFEFHYSPKHDVLSIYNYEKSRPEETVEFSEYLNIDIDKENRIIGLEIFDATEFFGALNVGVDKEFLQNLEAVDLQQKEFRNNWFLAIILKSGEKIITQPLPLLRKSEYISPFVQYLQSLKH